MVISHLAVGNVNCRPIKLRRGVRYLLTTPFAVVAVLMLGKLLLAAIRWALLNG